MKDRVITEIQMRMSRVLSQVQLTELTQVLSAVFQSVEVVKRTDNTIQESIDNVGLLKMFLSAKRVEGCSDKSLKYYESTIQMLLTKSDIPIREIDTDNLRGYLSDYQKERKSSKVTIDNMRRIFSSFFGWLEDEDYILKSPVRRIHKIKTDKPIKETLSDESLELLRDSCTEIRDLAMIDLLASTGMRVGELVGLDQADINFHERECVVFGKGGSERLVYFDARTKIHLMTYLESRTDENSALFVSLGKPHERLLIGGVETRLREIGKKADLQKVHPHKFRRTLATRAIDKGMPIEQVQHLLGHVKIDTTMHYAMVNQANVKNSHRKFIG
ncbi:MULTISPECIES: site-specific tyrosine recombinase/integron integrase [Lactococcus]|uniref:Tyrosine-type recombinase/integrase n=1 Tax=Lactococcus lactis subsp. cremoris TaxID=1359 RepID=A0A1V0PE69_LACLC|nr:site-specific tyrosine recombinase/integron integrase [Lactococcus cremoris]ARE24826.1 tyrosine-type recombinase/integrase [Lactococcus cremoris]ARE27282.1 tyrosine-type recombinase/integrase [Lactococcus cremoris]